ncbi:MAG: hypothetical protein J6E44_02290 [Lachnospiraceae bacterium]|nr:hypothetical protein [Lachnospiraceae bacterium]
MNSANSSGKGKETRNAGAASADDLKSFMENTVAVNAPEAVPFDGDMTQPSGHALFDGDMTQSSGHALFDGDATQSSGHALFDGDATQSSGHTLFDDPVVQHGGSVYAKHDPSAANSNNPAASFNRSGDLVGYPGEEEAASGKSKTKKESGKKGASRKKIRLIAGIASGVLIAGIVGFGLGRILPGPGHDDNANHKDDRVESVAGSTASVPEAVPQATGPADSTDSPESTDVPADSSVTDPTGSNSGEGQPDTDANADNGSGGDVNYDTRSAVSDAIEGAEYVEPGTADNIEDNTVNGPNVSGDIPVNAEGA